MLVLYDEIYFIVHTIRVLLIHKDWKSISSSRKAYGEVILHCPCKMKMTLRFVMICNIKCNWFSYVLAPSWLVSDDTVMHLATSEGGVSLILLFLKFVQIINFLLRLRIDLILVTSIYSLLQLSSSCKRIVFVI